MNANEIHPAIVQGIYKQAADDILSKIKAALGIEEEAPAIDAVSGGLTAGAITPGAVLGARGAAAGGAKLSKILEHAGATAAMDAARGHSYAPGGMSISGATRNRKLKSLLAGAAKTGSKAFGSKRGMQIAGGAAGGLLSASAMYALSNPRTRAALSKLIG